MNAIYHLNSADDINADILDSIKAAFKSKPITITIEEDDLEINQEMKTVLEDRLREDTATYLTASESLDKLKKKYGILGYKMISLINNEKRGFKII